MSDPLTVNDVEPYLPQYAPKREDKKDQASGKKPKSDAAADAEQPQVDEQESKAAVAPEHLGRQVDLEDLTCQRRDNKIEAIQPARSCQPSCRS